MKAVGRAGIRSLLITAIPAQESDTPSLAGTTVALDQQSDRMRFTEIDLLGICVAPISVLMVVARVVNVLHLV